jgi:hypothetical protein
LHPNLALTSRPDGRARAPSGTGDGAAALP